MRQGILNLMDGSRYNNGMRLVLIFIVVIILLAVSILVGRGFTKSK